jgi:hypothetical protein
MRAVENKIILQRRIMAESPQSSVWESKVPGFPWRLRHRPTPSIKPKSALAQRLADHEEYLLHVDSRSMQKKTVRELEAFLRGLMMHGNED